MGEKGDILVKDKKYFENGSLKMIKPHECLHSFWNNPFHSYEDIFPQIFQYVSTLFPIMESYVMNYFLLFVMCRWET